MTLDDFLVETRSEIAALLNDGTTYTEQTFCEVACKQRTTTCG